MKRVENSYSKQNGMKNFWIALVSAVSSFFKSNVRAPRRVKGRCARVENLENRLALSASLPASDVALIREAFLEENVASLMGEYGSSSAGTMSAIDLSALIETAILDEDGALFDEGYEQTEFGSTAPVNLSVNNEEFTTSALEVGATNAYADLIAEAESLEIEDVSETPLSELDFKGNLDAEMEYYFDRYGVYINGERCISLSDAAKLPQNFLSRVADARRNASLSASSEQNGLRSGGGGSELEEVDIVLGIEYVRASGSPASSVNITGAISEGHSPYSEYKTTTEYLAGDYMTVTLPGLPINYESHISFSGTATNCVDFVAYVAYPPSQVLNYTPLGFDHSGGSATVYIFPVEDAQKESDETATVNFGVPQLQGSGGVDTHTFNMLVSTATATIIDNDQWKINIAPESAYANLDEIVITEGNQAQEGETATNKVSFTISRVEDVAYHAGDNHYPINVSLRFQNGTATFNDYKILHPEPGGAIAWLTPNLTNEVYVTIPAESNSTTITIEAIDDSIIERLYETLSFSIVNAWNGSNTFTYDGASHELKIKDNDKLYLDTVQYLSNIDLVSDTQASFGTHWGNSIHWISNYQQNTLPVAYSSSSVMQCESATLGDVDPDVVVTVRFSWKYTDLNGDMQIAYSDWSSRSLSTGKSTAQLTNQFKTLFGEESAYYDLASTLVWEFRVNGEDRGDDGKIGSSVNPLYVTYKPPVGYSNGVYHSVIDIGCRAAHRTRGGSNEQAVFDKIWDKFETLTINKVDLVQGSVSTGELLTYYGKEPDYTFFEEDDILAYKHLTEINNLYYQTTEFASLARALDIYDSVYLSNIPALSGSGTVSVVDTDALLYYGDGICDTWRTFLIDVNAGQGIQCTGFGVSPTRSNYLLKVKTNIHGQGNQTPLENIWGGHALVYYNGDVYDPSYGVSYGSYSNYKYYLINNLDSIGQSVGITMFNYPVLYANSPYGYVYKPVQKTILNEIFDFDLLDDL